MFLFCNFILMKSWGKTGISTEVMTFSRKYRDLKADALELHFSAEWWGWEAQLPVTQSSGFAAMGSRPGLSTCLSCRAFLILLRALQRYPRKPPVCVSQVTWEGAGGIHRKQEDIKYCWKNSSHWVFFPVSSSSSQDRAAKSSRLSRIWEMCFSFL